MIVATPFYRKIEQQRIQERMTICQRENEVIQQDAAWKLHGGLFECASRSYARYLTFSGILGTSFASPNHFQNFPTSGIWLWLEEYTQNILQILRFQMI